MSCPKLSKKYWQPNSPGAWVSTVGPWSITHHVVHWLNVVTHYKEYSRQPIAACVVMGRAELYWAHERGDQATKPPG